MYMCHILLTTISNVENIYFSRHYRAKIVSLVKLSLLLFQDPHSFGAILELLIYYIWKREAVKELPVLESSSISGFISLCTLGKTTLAEKKGKKRLEYWKLLVVILVTCNHCWFSVDFHSGFVRCCTCTLGKEYGKRVTVEKKYMVKCWLAITYDFTRDFFLHLDLAVSTKTMA